MTGLNATEFNFFFFVLESERTAVLIEPCLLKILFTGSTQTLASCVVCDLVFDHSGVENEKDSW